MAAQKSLSAITLFLIVCSVKAQVDLPLYSSLEGGVYVGVSIGTLPQVVYVLVDTGSSLFAVAGSGFDCTSVPGATCGLPVCMQDDDFCVYGIYNFSLSSTATLFPYHTEPCQTWISGGSPLSNYCAFGAAYGAGGGPKIQGAYVTDTVNFGGGMIYDNMTIAAILLMTNATLLQEPPASGIMGLAYGGLANCYPATVIDPDTDDDDQAQVGFTCLPNSVAQMLYSSNLPDVVALCVYDNGTDAADGSETPQRAPPGVLTFGGVNPKYFQPNTMQFIDVVPIVTPSGNYYGQFVLDLVSMAAFGAVRVATESENLQVMLDSGTPSVVLSLSVCTALSNAVAARAIKCQKNADCNAQSRNQILVSLVSNATGAPISFDLGTILHCSSQVCALNYMPSLLNCLPDAEATTMILGNVFLRQYYTVFDKTNNVVGLAQKTNCSFS